MLWLILVFAAIMILEIVLGWLLYINRGYAQPADPSQENYPIITDREDALAHKIADRYRQFVPGNPSVSVGVKELNSYAIFVLGEVSKPGKFQAKSYVTLLQAISMAGGFTEYAKKNRLQVVRVNPNGDHKLHEMRIPVRYDDLLAGSGEPGNIILLSGDTVVVP